LTVGPRDPRVIFVSDTTKRTGVISMRLTTKGRFAVTAMIDLALRSHSGPVALAAISQRQQISLSYLEQLFGKLRRHELVESTRGPGGGYSLGRKVDEITVADIIVAVDEPIDATSCGGKENCMGDDSGRCMTHDLWASLNAKMIEYLDSISLKKLVEDQIAKGVSIEEAPVKRAISSSPVVKPIKITAPNSVFALGSSVSK
jgi:Rrf2 family transcriptional regulator, iron-sulfur cluster assembly transcription factor